MTGKGFWGGYMRIFLVCLGFLVCGVNIVSAQDEVSEKAKTALLQAIIDSGGDLATENNWGIPHLWYHAAVVDVWHATWPAPDGLFYSYANLVYNPELDEVFIVGDKIRAEWVACDGPQGCGLPLGNLYSAGIGYWCQKFERKTLCAQDWNKTPLLNAIARRWSGK